jgi:hypothetical protein
LNSAAQDLPRKIKSPGPTQLFLRPGKFDICFALYRMSAETSAHECQICQ